MESSIPEKNSLSTKEQIEKKYKKKSADELKQLETEGKGKFDEDGFFILNTDGKSFYDNDGVYFNEWGFDHEGGRYDE